MNIAMVLLLAFLTSLPASRVTNERDDSQVSSQSTNGARTDVGPVSDR